MKNRHSFFNNFPEQEDDKSTDPHFFLSKILIPFGSLLIAGILLLTSNYQLPKWVFISVVAFLVLVGAYIIIIIGPTLWKLASNLLLSMKKKRNRTRFSRYYLPRLHEAASGLDKFIEDHSDNVIHLLQIISGWPEMMNKPDTFDSEQLGYHVGTFRAWLQTVRYDLKNSGARDFSIIARNLGRLIYQYHRFCLNWQQRLDNFVRQEKIQGEHLRYLKQEWFTRREEITKFIDQWKPLAENINVIFEDSICNEYFDTLKTIE